MLGHASIDLIPKTMSVSILSLWGWPVLSSLTRVAVHSYDAPSLLRSLFRFEDLLLNSGFISQVHWTRGLRVAALWLVTDIWQAGHTLFAQTDTFCWCHHLQGMLLKYLTWNIFVVNPKAQVLDQTVGHRMSVWKLRSQKTAKPHLCPQDLERIIDAFITSRLERCNYGGWGPSPLLQI